MKTNNTVWKRVSLMLFISVITGLGFLISCEKENIRPVGAQELKTHPELPAELLPLPLICGEIAHRNLILEDNRKVGDVYLLNDRKYLYVHVLARDGIRLRNAFLFTGKMEAIPLSESMDPLISSFPYSISTNEFSTVKRFKIDLRNLSDKFIVSLMVQTTKRKISESENLMRYNNAWADGKLYGDRILGRLFTYKKGMCSNENEPVAFDE